MNAVEELYENESEGLSFEARTTKITLRCSAESAAMFTVIANRFGISRFSLLHRDLDSLAREFFHSLCDGDKIKLAEEADLEATEILSKAGVMVRGGPTDGVFHWRYMVPKKDEE